MKFRILFRPKAEKELDKIPKKNHKRILAAILGLRNDFFAGKKLGGEHKGHFSLRVWPYRVIYTVNIKESMIIIIRIGHRQGVY